MSNLSISLIHPSRGRANKAKATLDTWFSKANGVNFEHILSLDTNDADATNYHAPTLISDNSCVVEATNKAAKLSSGDILIYMSDDFDCPFDWTRLLIKEFTDAKGPILLKVDDCLQRFDVPVLTIPIMNRQLYDKLGYFWHPGYKSMFVDEDLYWTSKKLNALKLAPHLKFPHNHVSTGKAQDDETYRRTAAHWDSGKAFYAQRKAAGFPL